MTRQIFISYSKKDKEFAWKLADDLVSTGHKLWIDRSLQVGEDWEKTIEKNLAEAKEIDTSPIEEKDLKGKKSISTNGYLLIAIFFVLCILTVLVFLFIKLSGKQVTTKTEEQIENASFVLGEVEDSDHSGGYGESK